MSTYKAMKANKGAVFLAFIIGLAALFFVNNWTSQPAYDIISCTYNQYSCDGLEWDGECTGGIEDECCDYIDVDMCDGQEVSNGDECLHFYCDSPGKFCKPVYDDVQGGQYICTCSDIEEAT